MVAATKMDLDSLITAKQNCIQIQKFKLWMFS